MIIAYTLVSVVLVSLISFAGVLTLAVKKEFLYRILKLLVAVAAGALLGDALIHIIPEALQELENRMLTSLLILGGIILFYILEMFVRWHHCHIPAEDHVYKPVVPMNLIGDGAHNFIDGMLLAASYGVSIPIGIATTTAVLLHEIPQEIGDFGILISGGLSVKKALIFNFLSGVTAIIGAVVVLAVGSYSETFNLIVLSVAGGGFIYIAGTDLIPELHAGKCNKRRSVANLVAIIAGIFVMALLALME
ncbi:MAG: ZIP family metal transporter [Elusimicrobia bacterium]|jgi:zinc and cadmium transporter|nr:ZIP family metal transporter [Elusimicrobiota bacterium]